MLPVALKFPVGFVGRRRVVEGSISFVAASCCNIATCIRLRLEKALRYRDQASNKNYHNYEL